MTPCLPRHDGSVATLDELRSLISRDHGLAVVAVSRPNGTVGASVVNVGVLDHPHDGTPVVGFVVRGDAAKLRRLRLQPRATVTVRAAWEWVTVEGPVELAGPDDPFGAVDQPGLLRAIFQSAGGTHEDWDAFDRVMAEERRAAVLLRPERVYGIVR
jgi:PPOX class probable F420-dependent enzyme